MFGIKQKKLLVLVACISGIAIIGHHWRISWHNLLDKTNHHVGILEKLASPKPNRVLTYHDVKHVTVNNEEDCKNRQFLVFQCDTNCGGWGDRQKGSVSAFLLSLMTNRSFIININTPCDVGTLLKPAMYDWTMCKEYVQETLSKYPDKNFRLRLIEHHNVFRNQVRDYKTLWKSQIVTISLNFYILDEIRKFRLAEKELHWVFGSDDSEVIRMALQALYTPQARLNSELYDYIHGLTKQGHTLVCSHIRTGRNPTIPKDSEVRSKSSNVSAMFNFLDQYNDVTKYVIYVATDSNSVREAAAHRFRNYVNLNRKIIHVDRYDKEEMPDVLCDGYYTVLLEQYVLSRCDVLVLTRSNFGAMAAYLRGQSERLFIQDPNKGNIIRTNLTNLQAVYQFE